MITGLVLYITAPVRPPVPPVSEKVTPPPARPLKMKVVAVIIDDVGHNRQAARPFIEMDHPVALSILPGRPNSIELAHEAVRKGKTIMLHLPMQPEGYPGVDPGPGAILIDQNREEIRRTFEEDLAELPPISGVNNHMGSEATKDPRVMETVLELVKERGLFFIDSRTTPETVALKLARKMGIPSLKRDVFLDNVKTPSAIDARVDDLLDLAEKHGWAIGIGHPHEETARALERMALKAQERGIRWIPLEDLIARVNPGN